MNLQNIQLEHIKAFMVQDYLMVVIMIFLSIVITILMTNIINNLSLLSDDKINKMLNRAIPLLLICAIIASVTYTVTNRTKDHYKVTIENQETIEINKDQYNFLKKLKMKNTFGEKFTKEEINRAKDILIR